MKIRTGDLVLIIAGKEKGKSGRVMRTIADKNRVVVEGMNMRVRHVKKTVQQAGQRITFEASLSASNVMILDPKTKKPTRIGYKIDPKSGFKTRIAKVSGEVIKAAAITAPVKSKEDKEKIKDKAVKASEEGASKAQPFWKRGGKSADPAAAESQDAKMASHVEHPNPQATPRRSRESA